MTQRLVPFEGVHNFRDLGGYETDDGRHTRWARLYRSDAMHDLTSEDLEVFRALGIAAIVDLRSPAEIERTGRGLIGDEPHRFVSAPVLSNYATNESRGVIDESYLTRRYLQYLDVGAPAFVSVFEEMTKEENYPLVFNCFLGKDRTGVVAALVLSCLGVQRERVIEDYAISDDRMVHIVAKHPAPAEGTRRDRGRRPDPAQRARRHHGELPVGDRRALRGSGLVGRGRWSGA